MDYKPGCCLAMSAPALPVPGLEEVVAGGRQGDDAPAAGRRPDPSEQLLLLAGLDLVVVAAGDGDDGRAGGREHRRGPDGLVALVAAEVARQRVDDQPVEVPN